MYFLLGFLFIIILSIMSVLTRNKMGKLFSLLYIFLIILSVFRYGSGTDYFAYKYHYYSLPSNIESVIHFDNNMEIGFNLLMYFFNKLNIPFEFFLGLLSIFTLFIFLSIINNFSNSKMVSLMLFTAMYYPIYVNSAIRQGIGMALVLWGMFSYLKNQRYLKYSLLIIFASLFHVASMIGILFIPIYLLSNTKFNNSVVNTLLLGLSLILYLTNFSNYLLIFLRYIIPGFIYTPSETANSLTIVLRLFFLFFIFLLAKNIDTLNDFEKAVIYIYFIGNVIFFAVADIQILSRLLEYFIISEIIIIPNLMYRQNKISSRVMPTILLAIASLVLLMKDLDSFTQQQNYYKVGPLNYRYTTIFNKNRIYEYKEPHYLDMFK